MVSTSCFGTTNAARPPTLKNLIILKRRDGGVVERARLEIVLRATVRGFESLSLRQKGNRQEPIPFFTTSQLKSNQYL